MADEGRNKLVPLFKNKCHETNCCLSIYMYKYSYFTLKFFNFEFPIKKQDVTKQLLFGKFDPIYAEEAVYELPSQIINEAIYYLLIQQI